MEGTSLHSTDNDKNHSPRFLGQSCCIPIEYELLTKINFVLENITAKLRTCKYRNDKHVDSGSFILFSCHGLSRAKQLHGSCNANNSKGFLLSTGRPEHQQETQIFVCQGHQQQKFYGESMIKTQWVCSRPSPKGLYRCAIKVAFQRMTTDKTAKPK